MKTFFVLLILTTVVACDDNSIRRNSIEYFEKYLKEDMSYSELKLVFGEPDGDIGSGIHIYVYNLDDGTQVTIGYTDKILYARQINETNVLAELI